MAAQARAWPSAERFLTSPSGFNRSAQAPLTQSARRAQEGKGNTLLLSRARRALCVKLGNAGRLR
jgi:hypothetical protein